jgi:uncharacterized protein YlxP (DUF503 family)
VAVHVLALSVELHLPQCRSLKEKRAVVKSMTEGARKRYAVAASETDHLHSWQRARLAFACVSGSVGHATDVIDEVERFVWSFTESEVVEAQRTWLEVE